MGTQYCAIIPPASALAPTVPDPELSAIKSAIPQVRCVIEEIRRAVTPVQMLRVGHHLSILQDLLTSTTVESLADVTPPEPLRSNYRAHLQTLSFEIRRAKNVMLAERARLQGRLGRVQ